MPQEVTDSGSNQQAKIIGAARLIRRTKIRQRVFEYVCRGKKSLKTIQEIAEALHISKKQVLNAGHKLAVGDQIIKKVPGGYRKDPFFGVHYRKVLNAASSPGGIRKLINQDSPHVTIQHKVIRLSGRHSSEHLITIDDISNFSKLTRVKPKVSFPKGTSERRLKNWFKDILGETGEFKDWGGERGDLFTTKLSIGGKRKAALIAFKGRATRGKLTLDKLGKKADQIVRLFFGDAVNVFLIVYAGQVDQIVYDSMRAHALAKASTGTDVYWGVIDEDDLTRLQDVYPI